MKDLSGKRFGRLVVLRRAENNKSGDAFWFCKCDCDGKEVKVKGGSLRSGKTQSCTCYQKEFASKQHSGYEGQAAETQCFNTYRHNARTRSIPFDLSKEDFLNLTKENCFYCGQEPSQVVEVHSKNGTYVYNGVDRVDSSKGYTLDNCVACCGTHNLMKLDMTSTEFVAACRSVVNHFDTQSSS